MIAYLKGKVILSRFNLLVIETGGVGYKIQILPSLEVKKGEILELFVHQNLKEDSSDLYGFKSYDDLEVFQKLISVNGVGPKVGMAIMASADGKKIASAIENENLSFFTSIPGIGKKVAGKIILDLKTKISELGASNLVGGAESDMVEALVSLGYKKNQISKVILKMPKELKSDQEKIRWALKNLSNN